MKGKVTWYNTDKKYGFILGGDGKDYFVHASQISGVLNKDDEIFFNPMELDNKLKAYNVTKEAK